MVIDMAPNSKLDISKYLSRHGINVYDDNFKENKFKSKCGHDEFCPVTNELVMMKDFKRDDELNIQHKMDYIGDRLFVFENNHIANLVYCKISNKKLFKHYMKELKARRRHWNYYAIIVKKDDALMTKKELKINAELISVLEQCQVEKVVFDKMYNLTHMRKDIFKLIEGIQDRIKKENNANEA
jgi:hypothetical protein